MNTSSPQESYPALLESLGSLRMLLVLWRAKWSVIGVSVAFACVAAIYAWTAPSWFLAETVIVRVERQQMPALGQLGGLAALAGINLDSGRDDLPMVVLTSKEVAREFIMEQDILPVLFSSRWDEKKREWKNGREPDLREAVDFFDKRVRRVVEDTRRGNVRVGIRWTNAEQAADWSNRLVHMVNEKLRSRALQEATRNVEFLRKQMEATDVPVLQQALARAVEAELQKVMLATGGDEYAFKVVDRATAPLRRHSPRRMLIVFVGFLLGAAISMSCVLIRSLSSPRV